MIINEMVSNSGGSEGRSKARETTALEGKLLADISTPSITLAQNPTSDESFDLSNHFSSDTNESSSKIPPSTPSVTVRN